MVQFALWLNPGHQQKQQWLEAAAWLINKHSDASGIELNSSIWGREARWAPYIAADLRRARRGGTGPRGSRRCLLSGRNWLLITCSLFGNTLETSPGEIRRSLQNLKCWACISWKNPPANMTKRGGVTFGAFCSTNYGVQCLDHAVLNRKPDAIGRRQQTDRHCLAADDGHAGRAYRSRRCRRLEQLPARSKTAEPYQGQLPRR